MLLYDCGNTNIKCYENGKVTHVDDFDAQKPFYYINVNPKIKDFKNGIDLAPYFQLKSNYKGMGIDRVAACYSIRDGAIVDAGSAITVDVMSDGLHKGGFIMPGIGAYHDSLANISTALKFDIDYEIDLEILPQNTHEALNFATFKSAFLMIKEVSQKKKIYFCGGDANLFSRYFENSVYQKDLVFEGMKKVIMEIEC
ncbi:MAG TPA: type III pantothenate kinase [Campylobacterales bacterium]|nr:type III pantothenate kinase [Campylobacterales bacterium]